MQTRQLELQRRCEALPAEVKLWIERTTSELDKNSHYSQMRAIGVMMDVFITRQRELVQQLDANGSPAQFQTMLLSLISEIIKGQKVWDFFRSKFEQHRSPDFAKPLTIADTVAWDCYRPTLNKAYEFGIISADKFREPPLSYLNAEFSPATWPRGSTPGNELGLFLDNALLPIPVIEIPWDHVVNLWEFLSIHHEVGHDLEADLSLKPVLRKSLQDRLVKAKVPNERVRVWVAWEQEVFADLVGLLLAGPAFARYMVNLLMFPFKDVTAYKANDPHPTDYIRIFLNTSFIKTLLPEERSLGDDADKLDRTWIDLYGDVSKIGGHVVADFKNDFPTVFEALVDAKLGELRGHSIRELIPFASQDNAKIHAAASFLATGDSMPGAMQPRHVISASRLALERIVDRFGSASNAQLDELNQRTATMLEFNTAPGLRAADDSLKHRRYIEELTRAL